MSLSGRPKDEYRSAKREGGSMSPSGSPSGGDSPLNPGVAKREVWAWAMYDFANSGYTTVILTAVFRT
jgi:UMF1 family MFS transporter